MKKYFPIVMVIIAILVLAACESMYMRTARLAIRDENNPDKAIKNLKMEIQKNPNNADAYLFLSQIYGQYKQDYYVSYQYAKKAVELDPTKQKDVDLIYLTTWSQLHNQGLEALKAENYDAAILKLSQAHEIEPDSMITFELIGDTYIRADSIDKALDIFIQIYDMKPENIEALNKIATIYYNQENLEKAIEFFSILHNLEPENTDWLYNLWVSEMKMGNSEKAIDYAKQAVSIDPNNIELLYNIADTYFNEKKYGEAADYYKKIVSLDDSDWNLIRKWEGNSTKNTDNFEINSDKWKIAWYTKPSYQSEGNFIISVYKSDGSLTDIVANVIGENKDNSIMRGAGKYYFQINATQQYYIEVFENNNFEKNKLEEDKIEALKYLCYCLSNTKNYSDLVIYAQKWLDVELNSTEAQQFLNLAQQMLNK